MAGGTFSTGENHQEAIVYSVARLNELPPKEMGMGELGSITEKIKLHFCTSKTVTLKFISITENSLMKLIKDTSNNPFG